VGALNDQADMTRRRRSTGLRTAPTLRTAPAGRAARAALAALVVVAAPLVGLMGVGARPAGANSSFVTTRYGGSDRYDTARLVAEASYPHGAKTALLASGTNYPDALAGAYLAGNDGAPILLTDPNTLPSSTVQALSELQTQNVIILGGTYAVSDAIASELASTTSTSSAGGDLVVTRIAGPTRYDTAAAIATTGGTIGTISGAATALVASGDAFPDALTGGPAAFGSHLPILLTDPNQESPQTEAALEQLKITNVILLGGTDAISATVASQLTDNGARTVTRIAGADRTDTAAMFYQQIGIPDLGFSGTNIVVADGQDFADALAGSVLAGEFPTGTLLTDDPDSLGSYTTAELTAHQSTLTQGVILGGPDAISDTGQGAIVAAAGGGQTGTGGVTLNSTTVPAGGALEGSVADPATVSTLEADGCRVSQDVPFDASTGGFAVYIPSFVPTGTCDMTFTVTGDDGTITTVPTFTITVTAAQTSTEGSVTLDSTSTDDGGTLYGSISDPTVSTLSVDGCGLNGPVSYEASVGSFAVTIPTTQPLGDCTMVFTLNYDDDSPAQQATFTIDVTGTSGPTGAGGGGATAPTTPVTLESTEVQQGGTIDGSVAEPSSVATLSADGCGLDQGLTFNATSGDFDFTIPASQPAGNCSLEFTVTYNGGIPTQQPTFTITVDSASTGLLGL